MLYLNLSIFSLITLGQPSTWKSPWNDPKIEPMKHYDPIIYDNAYVVDTIDINNPRIISFGYPEAQSDFLFVTDSVTAKKIVNEIKSIKKWSDFEQYFKNEKNSINSCYVFMMSADFISEEFLINNVKRKRENNNFVCFTKEVTINDGIEVGSFDGHPILLGEFTQNNIQKFVLVLVNAGWLRYRCVDCNEQRYYPPAVMPYNKYVKVVFPILQK